MGELGAHRRRTQEELKLDGEGVGASNKAAFGDAADHPFALDTSRWPAGLRGTRGEHTKGKINILAPSKYHSTKRRSSRTGLQFVLWEYPCWKAVALWRRFSVPHYVASHSVPRGDIAPYRTSTSICCAGPRRAQPRSESVSLWTENALISTKR
jgi:hypothetical protein